MITATLIEDGKERLDITHELFGYSYPSIIELAIYKVATQLSVDYSGGYWDFYKLSNGGFFQTPPEDLYIIQCPNDYRAVVTSYELGIIVCLYVYSSLSFNENLQKMMSNQYHLLRPYALSLENCDKIILAID